VLEAGLHNVGGILVLRQGHHLRGHLAHNRIPAGGRGQRGGEESSGIGVGECGLCQGEGIRQSGQEPVGEAPAPAPTQLALPSCHVLLQAASSQRPFPTSTPRVHRQRPPGIQ
jgi:hypothetical protein